MIAQLFDGLEVVDFVGQGRGFGFRVTKRNGIVTYEIFEGGRWRESFAQELEIYLEDVGAVKGQ
ncbi:MAG: hypothetical protein C0467_21890 [Planctomycetaceae bacterium]|nr:hypothetical protein [Planctomycetaceae bacterium]